MSESWVLLFWLALASDGDIAATSQTISFASEDACRSAATEVYAGLDPSYRDETGSAFGVHAVCLRTDAVDTIALHDVNRALQAQQAE